VKGKTRTLAGHQVFRENRLRGVAALRKSPHSVRKIPLDAAPTDPAVKVDGTLLTRGYIAIQSETAPIDFRKIEMVNFEGCADPKAKNYKAYVVKSDPKRCQY
jgi:hypothetical protein